MLTDEQSKNWSLTFCDADEALRLTDDRLKEPLVPLLPLLSMMRHLSCPSGSSSVSLPPLFCCPLSLSLPSPLFVSMSPSLSLSYFCFYLCSVCMSLSPVSVSLSSVSSVSVSMSLSPLSFCPLSL